MGKRFGVSISHYGGVSWELSLLQSELVRRKVPLLDIRGCAYPEMARAEQVRQARLAEVEVLVFVDGHVVVDADEIEVLVSIAESHGVASSSLSHDPQSLECTAVRRDIIEAMIRQEERRYLNSAQVEQVWSGEKVGSVPLASPWKRDGQSYEPGVYLTDSQAFMLRARNVGAVVAEKALTVHGGRRKKMRSRWSNALKPITGEPGSQFALCIPSFGALDLDQQKSIAMLEAAGMVVIALHDCPWIDIARSWLAETALGLGRGVFFLDHDIQFMPNDVLRLCEQALTLNAVVAAPYCMRKSGRNIIGSFDVPPGPIPFFKNGQTLPAYYSGLGFAAIPAAVLQGIDAPKLRCPALLEGLGWSAPVRPWFALDCSTGFYAGEDVSFCNRVHDLTVRIMEAEPGMDANWELSHGGRPARVFLDSRVRIAHRGVYDYGIEDAGIVVPRVDDLESTLTTSRSEARALLVNALDLPVEVQLATRELELCDP